MMGCAVVPGMVSAGAHGGPRPPVSRIVFNKYDKDNSDSMDASEFKFMCMDLGHEYSEEELAQAVLKLDSAGTGIISYDDFLVWYKSDEKWEDLHLEEEELLQLTMLLQEFQVFDADDDGKIDKAEFDGLFESLKAGGSTKESETIWAEMAAVSSCDPPPPVLMSLCAATCVTGS